MDICSLLAHETNGTVIIYCIISMQAKQGEKHNFIGVQSYFTLLSFHRFEEPTIHSIRWCKAKSKETFRKWIACVGRWTIRTIIGRFSSPSQTDITLCFFILTRLFVDYYYLPRHLATISNIQPVISPFSLSPFYMIIVQLAYELTYCSIHKVVNTIFIFVLC